MSEHPREHDDDFADRVAHALRAPERFDDDFERSLVDAIRADRPIDRSIEPRRGALSLAWWNTPRSIHMTPVMALALAASIAAIAALGAVKLVPARTIGVPTAVAQAPAAPDTVTLVRFVFMGPAKSVSVVGDFNAWGTNATPMHTTANGAWTVSVPVPSGRHEYAFIVDGKRWVPDPYAPTSSDDFDTKSSVLMVGS